MVLYLISDIQWLSGCLPPDCVSRKCAGVLQRLDAGFDTGRPPDGAAVWILLSLHGTLEPSEGSLV